MLVRSLRAITVVGQQQAVSPLPLIRRTKTIVADSRRLSAHFTLECNVKRYQQNGFLLIPDVDQDPRLGPRPHACPTRRKQKNRARLVATLYPGIDKSFLPFSKARVPCPTTDDSDDASRNSERCPSLHALGHPDLLRVGSVYSVCRFKPQAFWPSPSKNIAPSAGELSPLFPGRLQPQPPALPPP